MKSANERQRVSSMSSLIVLDSHPMQTLEQYAFVYEAIIDGIFDRIMVPLHAYFKISIPYFLYLIPPFLYLILSPMISIFLLFSSTPNTYCLIDFTGS